MVERSQLMREITALSEAHYDELLGRNVPAAEHFRAISPDEADAFFNVLDRFQKPECHTNYRDCAIVYWPDLFRIAGVLPPAHRIERNLDDDESKRKIVAGFNQLLWALFVNRWWNGDDRSPTQSEVGLMLVSGHLSDAYELFEDAGVSYEKASIDDDLITIREKLEDRELTYIDNIETAILRLILGYALAIQEQGVAIDWKKAEEEMAPAAPVEEPPPPPSPPPADVTPPPEEEKSEPVDETPTEPVPNRAPMVRIIGVDSIPPDQSTFTLDAKAVDPDGDPMTYRWRVLKGPVKISSGRNSRRAVFERTDTKTPRAEATVEVSVTDRPPVADDAMNARAVKDIVIRGIDVGGLTAQYRDVAKKTGGTSQTALSPEGVKNEVLERIPFRQDPGRPKRHYQILFLVDSSGSMGNNVGNLKEDIEKVVDLAKDQLPEDGSVSIAVRYFVDNIYGNKGQLVPLEGKKILDGRKSRNSVRTSLDREATEASDALDKIIKMIGGDREYHWEALVNATRGEPWIEGDGAEKVIFLLTDEGDDDGRNLKVQTKDTAVAVLKKKGIRFEHVLYESAGSGRGCFSGDMLLMKQDGTVVSFDELAESKRKGEALPTLASWNTSTGAIVYQQPAEFLEHDVQSAMHYLRIVGDDSMKPLEVTGNHRMYVSRGGERDWVSVEGLEREDALVNPLGGYYHWDPDSKIVHGSFKVYNLHFDQEAGQFSNYLVSPDGLHWFIAHNTKIYF